MPQGRYDVGSIDQFATGTMRQVDAADTSVLLIHDGTAIHAVSATCPHAGGPLAEGIRRGERIVCPWHKATFCIRTGKVLEPPAVDALARYDVHIEGRRIVLTEPEAPISPDEPKPDDRCFAIVGGGAAGAVAAQTLREEGFAGRVVILDRENRVPYDRTILSKYHLSGETGAEKSPLQSQTYYREHRIERRTAEVVRLDVAQRRIFCEDGSTLDYDAALLATGGTPRRPDTPGAGLAGVFVLRSRADADAILAQAERSERAVVSGLGFIGMEVAASLRERGLDVTVVGKHAAPFERQLGPRIGGAFTALHERHGVAFRFGREIAAFVGERDVRSVRLDDGADLPADLVVIGAGVAPATSYASGVTLNDDGGLPVDAALRVAPGLYAAGDIASFPLYGDGEPIRVEHWRVAEQHGRVAALNMLGKAARYDAPPVFWTIHYMKRLDYIGHAADWDDIVVHGDLGKPEFIAYYVKAGRVVAAAGMDRDQDTAALGELFAVRQDWTPDELGERPADVLATLGLPPR